MTSKYRIALIIPYFGKFPDWAHLFFETIRRNSDVNFLFYTDCDYTPYQEIHNCTFHAISFQNYIQNAREKTGIVFNPANAYKLCDLRPLYPIIHYDDILDYDFYGWTDMDVLFGNIRDFYTDSLLMNYDVFSTHKIRISGHLAIFRNKMKYREAYKQIYRWREHLAFPEFVGIDEHGITNALTMTFFDKLNEKMNWSVDNFITRWMKKIKTKKYYMVEQYTTPFTSIPWIDGSINSQQPDVWYYKDGNVTNQRDGDRRFIYLHFMNFKSASYRHDASPAPWEGKENIVAATVEDMKRGIIISPEGIKPIDTDARRK